MKVSVSVLSNEIKPQDIVKKLDLSKPDYIHILINGRIVKTGDVTLAQEIEEKGYKSFDNCVSLVSED